MKLSDREFELLSAFHDGELSAGAAKALKARLALDPALRDALDDIRTVSAALRPLRPAQDIRPDEPIMQSWRSWSIAASLAFFLLTAASAFWMFSEPAITPLSQHREFLSRSYPANSVSDVQPVSWLVNGAPDLSAANLRLVDIAAFEGNGIYFHYTGVNGCRLTVGVHGQTPPVQPTSATAMVNVWSTNETYYSMIADRMDAGKFEAIRDLLELWSRPVGPDETTILALRDATSSAQPCGQA
jgi:hypothetical protein